MRHLRLVYASGDAPHALAPERWRWRSLRARCLLAALLALLSAYALSGPAGMLHRYSSRTLAVVGASVTRGLARLPLAAQAPVSDTLGADNPVYRVGHGPYGLVVINPVQRLSAAFTRSAVTVRAGGGSVSVRLVAISNGASSRSMGPVEPSARANQVTYAHPGVREWYANGPLGLEQGFTLVRRRSGNTESGSVTLALALTGSLRPRVAGGSRSLTFLTARGRPVLRYSGLLATDARGRALSAWFVLSEDRLLIRVDARGASYPLQIDPTFSEIAELTASNDQSGGLGGFGPGGGAAWTPTVAIEGSTIVAGAPTAPVNANSAQGAVYVFTEPTTGWQNAIETAELTASDGAANDYLGTSVAISGSTIVAGAPNRGVNGQGAVYVFTEPGTGWRSENQTAELTASDATNTNAPYLGEAVAIAGSTIFAGAPKYRVRLATKAQCTFTTNRQPVGRTRLRTASGFPRSRRLLNAMPLSDLAPPCRSPEPRPRSAQQIGGHLRRQTPARFMCSRSPPRVGELRPRSQS
jgi:hypothetical protein